MDDEQEPDPAKREKFRELAEKRMNKALQSIRLIGNLSNRSSYAYEESEARKMVRTLADAVAEVGARFNKASERTSGNFRL